MRNRAQEHSVCKMSGRDFPMRGGWPLTFWPLTKPGKKGIHPLEWHPGEPSAPDAAPFSEGAMICAAAGTARGGVGRWVSPGKVSAGLSDQIQGGAGVHSKAITRGARHTQSPPEKPPRRSRNPNPAPRLEAHHGAVEAQLRLGSNHPRGVHLVQLVQAIRAGHHSIHHYPTPTTGHRTTPR